MIALSVAKLKVFSSECQISLWIKPKRRKKTFFVESLDQFRRLEVREKARNVFVMSLRLSDNKVLHNIASVLIKFFSISLWFACFFHSYFVLPNFWSWRNLIKQLFHSRLLDMRLIWDYAPRWLFTISYPTRAYGIIVNYFFLCRPVFDYRVRSNFATKHPSSAYFAAIFSKNLFFVFPIRWKWM